ncbi:MAG TPA: hypothetical protein VG733_14405 [Chthoniobacteraceae bacterium]|nr:hypothetical protein [Chthoniobacteraceae bacterium]
MVKEGENRELRGHDERRKRRKLGPQAPRSGNEMPSELIKPERIAAFWSWFSLNVSDFQRALDMNNTAGISEKIESAIKALDDRVGWEFGPGVKASYGFSISLNDSLENMPIAEAIIRAAPRLKGWEFHAGRPPKNWYGSIDFYNRTGQRLSLDVSTWRYLLTSLQKGAFWGEPKGLFIPTSVP